MKKSISILSAIMCGCMVFGAGSALYKAPAVQANADTNVEIVNDLAVMSYNVLGANLHPKGYTFDKIRVDGSTKTRMDGFKETLDDKQPDVVGMQEFCHDTAYAEWEAVTDLVSESRYQFVNKVTDEGLHNSCPILYNAATVRVLEEGSKPYSMRYDNRLGWRVLTWAYCEKIETGDRFIVTNTHLEVAGTEYGYKMQKQQLEDKKAYETDLIEKYNAPLIAVGDFNLWHGTDEVRTTSSGYVTEGFGRLYQKEYVEKMGFKDAIDNAAEDGTVIGLLAKSSPNDWIWLKDDANRGTLSGVEYDYARESAVSYDKTLDQIAYSSELKATYYETIINETTWETSDHYPVFATLDFPESDEADAIATFDMEEGASIRRIEPSGIRFKAKISEKLSANLENAEYGMLIIPSSLLGGNALTLETEDVLNIPAEKTYVEDGYLMYNAVLIGENGNFSAEHYNVPLTAVGYVTYGEEGAKTTVYTPTTVERSVVEVAQAHLKETGEENEFLTGIVDTVVTELSFAETEITLDVGDTVTPTLNGTQGLSYTLTTNSDCLSIDENNVMTAIEAGEAKISVQIGSRTTEMTITVNDPEPLVGDVVYSLNCADGASQIDYTGENTWGFKTAAYGTEKKYKGEGTFKFEFNPIATNGDEQKDAQIKLLEQNVNLANYEYLEFSVYLQGNYTTTVPVSTTLAGVKATGNMTVGKWTTLRVLLTDVTATTLSGKITFGEWSKITDPETVIYISAIRAVALDDITVDNGDVVYAFNDSEKSASLLTGKNWLSGGKTPTLSYDETIYVSDTESVSGSETGGLKLEFGATGNERFTFAAASITDLSAYDYVEFEIFIAESDATRTEIACQFVIAGNTQNVYAKVNEWTTVRVNLDEGKKTILSNDTITLGAGPVWEGEKYNINAGSVVYLTAIRGYANA